MRKHAHCFALGFLGCLAGIAYAAEPVLSVTAIRQDWPWSPLVNIDFTLAGGDEGAKYDVTMRGFVRGSEIVMPTASFTGGSLSGLSNGAHRAVWNPTLAGYAGKGRLPDFNVALTAVPSPTYMIVNLTKGLGEEGQLTYRYDEGVWLGFTNDTAYATTNLVLRRIPAGTFLMGSPSGELGRSAAETRHTVVLTKDFYIGVYEVTQYQWYLIQSNWPSYFSNPEFRNTRPVEQTSWQMIRGTSSAARAWPTNATVDAASFVGKLRARTGLGGFDLPTDAQWEYACRAGKGTGLNNGTDITNTTADANLAQLGRYKYNGGYCTSNRLDTGAAVYYDPVPGSAFGLSNGTAAVGSYLPNAWGLFDMHGNVFEWCLDFWETPMTSLTQTNPLGPTGPGFYLPSPPYGWIWKRIKRGGAWSEYGDASICRSAWRAPLFTQAYIADYDNYRDNGFRIAFHLP